MKIDKLRLHNFRNFSEKTFEFPNLFTVVIGENGKGKSTLLQGLRLAVATFLLGLDESERLHMRKEDVRRIDTGKRFAPQSNCFFEATGNINNIPSIWKRTLSKVAGRTDYKEAQHFIKIAEELNYKVNTELLTAVDLPVICFFSTARLWSESKQTINLKKKGSKLKDGYARCLDEKSDKTSSLGWIKSNYYKRLKGKESKGLLDAVFEAITTCVPKWRDLEWDEDNDDLAGIYTQEDGSESYLPLYYLSDGLRTMAGLAAEVAYRCVVLNDHRGAEAVKKSQGVVLIDEIDMHLHPNWQRTVIADFKKAFPNIQFVVTTHSPFIVQSVKGDELINLDTVTEADPIKLGLEEVAKEIMQVDDTRSIYYQQSFDAAASYFKLLAEAADATDPENKRNIKQQLDKLEVHFQEDPAYAAFLKLNRLAKLGKE